MSIKHMAHCLNPTLTALIQQASTHKKIEGMVREALPEQLRAHCFVGGFVNGCLLLHVDDPVWLTLVRYQLSALRTCLRQEKKLYQLTSIEIKLHPGLAEVKTLKRTQARRSLSAPVRDIINQVGTLTTFEPLSQALKRLAREDK